MEEHPRMYGMESDYAVPAKSRFELIKMISKKLSKVRNIESHVATVVEISD